MRLLAWQDYKLNADINTLTCSCYLEGENEYLYEMRGSKNTDINFKVVLKEARGSAKWIMLDKK